jgi:pyruvate dehydrogenase E1 component alpha subunit/2-oxoisovalerate dehydrogenase E1 component alpha subunit
MLSPLIRNLGSMLVQGATPLEILRQYMAKAESPTRGRELNIHFGDLVRGFIGQISHLGDMIPVMAGVALSFKMRKEARVALAYVGDGAMSTGAFHEGINFAAVQQLPLVIICENNGWAYSTPSYKQTAVKQLADKARAYGIPGARTDGNDVLACYEVTRKAVERARAGGGATLIEFVTYRRKGHAEHDNQSYQPKEQIAEWEKNDPVDRYVKQLVGNGWATGEEMSGIDDRVMKELDAAVALCENEPLPDVGTALDAVYADPAVMDTEWYRANGR